MCILLTLQITACQPARPITDSLSDDDVAAITTVRETLIQAWLNGDSAAVAALYTEAAVFMPPNESVVKGRSNIQAWDQKLNDLGPGLPELSLTPIDIDGRGDLAYDRGTFSELDFMKRRTTGKYVIILRKQPSGEWLIETFMWNADEPPPE